MPTRQDAWRCSYSRDLFQGIRIRFAANVSALLELPLSFGDAGTSGRGNGNANTFAGFWSIARADTGPGHVTVTG